MAKRRGHGEGAIYQRADGIWTTAVELPRGADNQRRRKVIYGKTRKEVTSKLQDLLAEQLKGPLADPGRETVRQFLERWLADVAAHRVRPRTLDSYRSCLEPHVYPDLGGLLLAKLEGAHLQRLYSAKLNAGLSRRTVQYIHSVVRMALDQAVKWGLLARNPAATADAPRPTRKEMAVLSLEQLQQLIAILQDDDLGSLYLVALATGCRRGELVALRWSDVDLQRSAIQINRTAERVKRPGEPYQVVWSEPKTAKSRRLIPLPAETVAVLRQQRVQQKEARLGQGPHWTDHDLVWCRGSGQPLDPGHVSQHFTHLLAKYGLPKVRLHDLRHTHATLLLQAGIHPKVVSERLGHSTTTLTMDVYSHVMPTMQEQAAQVLNTMLAPSKPRKKGTS